MGEEKKEAQNDSKTEDRAYGEFICAVFYGTHCKPEIAANLAQKLIDEFFNNFPSELQKLLIRLDRESADDDDEDLDESEFGICYLDSDGDKMQNKHKEYIM